MYNVYAFWFMFIYNTYEWHIFLYNTQIFF